MSTVAAEDKALLVASKAFTVESVSQSWAYLLSTIAILAGLTAAAVLLPWWPARLLTAVVAGLTIVRLFCLYHDFQHGALLRGSKLARGIFWLYGELALTPPTVWRETHNYHHAHTAKLIGSHIGSYPMVTPRMYAALSPVKKWLYRAARHPLNVASALVTVFAVGMCARAFLRAPKAHWDGAVSLLMVTGLGAASIFTGHTEAWLFGYVVPMAVATAAGAYLFYAQHNYPGVKVAPRETWRFVTAATESSSYMKMSPLMNWFTANIGYHHVHHLNAAIPFYRLPEAMAALPALQNPGVTGLSPRDIVACFQLKLWDPEKNAMVGYEAVDALGDGGLKPSQAA
ncbi:MAG: fatty acid desaturase [Myxococcaceae bacterium]|nr:fatty acid desaturase [Myxococcaceae bacterium]